MRRASLVARIRARQAAGLMPVLAEIKVRSPKEGDLLRGRRPTDLAMVYLSRPVAGISVVTEPAQFGGSLDIVRGVAALGDVPILRKDFLLDRASMEETAAAGATAVLLTVSLLGMDTLAALHADARACGLETLVETHSAEELAALIEHGLTPDLLGINNRDIRVGEVDAGDVRLTERIAWRVPPGWLVLSESAIANADDARRARDAGADAVLVGTAILQAPDPATKIDELIGVGWRTAGGR